MFASFVQASIRFIVRQHPASWPFVCCASDTQAWTVHKRPQCLMATHQHCKQPDVSAQPARHGRQHDAHNLQHACHICCNGWRLLQQCDRRQMFPTAAWIRFRRVPLRGWLLLILCFAACGAVFSFTYLQHLEVSHKTKWQHGMSC